MTFVAGIIFQLLVLFAGRYWEGRLALVYAIFDALLVIRIAVSDDALPSAPQLRQR
jgi:hypothetical protein